MDRMGEGLGAPAINPYAAPVAPLDSGNGEPSAFAYQSPSPLAKAAAAALAAVAVVELVGAANALGTIAVMNRVIAGESVSQAELSAVDVRSAVLAIIAAVAQLATVVLFCFFIPRANRNARSFVGGPFEFTPRWAAGIFFVPFVNLYKPYRAVKEIWQASATPPDPRIPWQFAPVPSLLPWWWGLYLFSSFVSQLTTRLTGNIESPDELISASWGQIVSGAATLAAAAAAAKMVLTLARHQEARAVRPA